MPKKKKISTEQELISKAGCLLATLYQFLGGKFLDTNNKNTVEAVSLMDIIIELLDELDPFFDEDIDNKVSKALDDKLKRRLISNKKLIAKQKLEEEKDKNKRIYPCCKCGKLRSANEGGTVFSVCEDCWDDHNK